VGSRVPDPDRLAEQSRLQSAENLIGSLRMSLTNKNLIGKAIVHRSDGGGEYLCLEVELARIEIRIDRPGPARIRFGRKVVASTQSEDIKVEDLTDQLVKVLADAKQIT
jgi:hypothetical protein